MPKQRPRTTAEIFFQQDETRAQIGRPGRKELGEERGHGIEVGAVAVPERHNCAGRALEEAVDRGGLHGGDRGRMLKIRMFPSAEKPARVLLLCARPLG